MGNIKGTKRGSYKKKDKISSPVYKRPEIIDKVKNNLDAIEKEEPLKDWKEVKNFEKEIVLIPEYTYSEGEHYNEIKKEEITPEFKEAVTASVNTHIEKSGEESLNDFLNSFEKVEPKSKTETTEEEKIRKPRRKKEEDSEQAIRDSNAMLINGSMLIAMCDFFFPGILKFVFTKFFKNKNAGKVKHEDVRLNPDQVKSIEPVSDHAAKVIFEKVNPMILFFVGMFVMYGMNFKMALDNIEEKQKAK